MKLWPAKCQTKQTRKHRITRNICFGALMLMSVNAIALATIVVPPPTAYAQDDVIKPEWKQEHTSSWESNINGKAYSHLRYSHYDDKGNLVGKVFYNEKDNQVISHVKWIFYRSDQQNGIKKGTLIIEPSDEQGCMQIYYDQPWTSDGEIKNTITHLIFKKATINNKVVPVTLESVEKYEDLFNSLPTVNVIDLRGLAFAYKDIAGSFNYAGCKANAVFSGDRNLHTLIFDRNLTFERAWDFSSMFNGCWKLKHILCKDYNDDLSDYEKNHPECDLSGLANFNTKRATDMSSMFHQCFSMTDFKFSDYPNFDTSKVKKFNSMFTAVNTSLAQTDIFNIVDGQLKGLSGSFNLRKLDLSSFDTSSAQDMRWMFRGQEGLQELNLSGKFNTKNASQLNMFDGVHALSKLTINKNFNFSNIAKLAEPNDLVYTTYVQPIIKPNSKARYSGKWIVLKNNKPLPNVSFTTAELWNSDRFHKLLQQEAPGENDTLTLTWENKNDVSHAPTVTFMVENGVFEDGKFVHTVEVGADNKVEASAIPTKTKTGSAIKGWYKLGDASKTAVDCNTTTFQENTTLVAILDDTGTQGGAGTGGSGDTGGSGTGDSSGSGTGSSAGGGTNTNPSTPSNPETPRTFDTVTTRLAGDNAFDTMEHISKTAFPDHSKYAVLATSEGYWDALSASSLAGTLDAPVLLSKPHELPEQTIRELKRLGVEKVYICGGEYALSSDIDAALQNMNIATERVSGAWASDTANEVVRHVPDSDTAFLATSWGYEDALSAASYAYAHKTPLFLANYHTSALDADTLATMQEKGVKTVYIVGGYDVVSPDVEVQLADAGIKALRIGGKTAYDTSALLARKLIALGMHANNMALATGWGYTDALTSAALCGKNNAVLVLADDSNQTTVNGVVALYNDTIEHMYLLGGQKVVGDRVINVLKAVFNKVDEQEK